MLDRCAFPSRATDEPNFGYRVQQHIANVDIKIYTRRGNNWTNSFKKIAGDAYRRSDSCVMIRTLFRLVLGGPAGSPDPLRGGRPRASSVTGSSVQTK
jgi:hypothetical protein